MNVCSRLGYLLLTERDFLVHDAVGMRSDCDCGERDTVHDEAPRNSWPGHFAGSDDTHKLERRRRRAARVIRLPPEIRRHSRATRGVRATPSADYPAAMLCTRLVPRAE